LTNFPDETLTRGFIYVEANIFITTFERMSRTR